MIRILYLQASFVPPPADREKDRFQLLSSQLEGDILQPVWFRTASEVEAIFGPGSYPVHEVGRFRYHWFLAFRHQGIRQRLAIFAFYFRAGLRICKERRPACIIAYSHMTTALCAVALKLLGGARRFIPELMTAPEKAFLVDSPKPGPISRLKHLYSDLCLHGSVLFADRVHLLYRGQLSCYPLLRGKPCSIFHDFTNVFPATAGHAEKRAEERAEERELLILLAGSPWYLKGVDLAIAAFRSICAEFPDAKLLIAGHYPDGKPLELASGCPQIQISKPLPHAELLQLMDKAAIMVLPSRTEGLPRILIEGLSAGLPLVGSDVGGIPNLIEDGGNGFVFPSGNSSILAQHLRTLLADASLRRQMGLRSLEQAGKFTEGVYVEQFSKMVRETL